jgi:hypothetical protein
MIVVKVGMTKGTTRPNDVKNQINKWCKDKNVEEKAEILFAVETDPIDSRSLETLEGRLRKKMGYLLDSGYINKIGLPIHTEWCLSNEKNIKWLKEKKPKSYDALNEVKTFTQHQPEPEQIVFATLCIDSVVF